MDRSGTGKHPAQFSRRQLAALTSIGALAGGFWTVGLASVLRSAEPDLTILGEDDWQVMLLESGTDRVLFLVGTFEKDPNPAIRQVLSTLRQHVDLVVATSSAIGYLDRTGPIKRSTWIQLDADPTQPDSVRQRALRRRLVATLKGGEIDLQRILQHEWSRANQQPASWVANLTFGDVRIAIGNDLASAASAASPASTVLIAPRGDIGGALGLLPGTSIVTNGDRVGAPSANLARADGYLVRTFPRDSARLRFSDGKISLPGWAQPIAEVTG